MEDKKFPQGRLIFFATGNVHKFGEARKVLAEYSVAVAMLRMKASEIQDDNIEKIAKTSVLDVVNKTRLPVIVEDAGLFIDALNRFPGPYSKFVYRTIGNEGILKLLENRSDRKARFKSVIAFRNKTFSKCFHGVVEGRIAEKIRGTSGFGFDPVFEPMEKPGRTFGEMKTEEKNQLSHRSRALRNFAEWYKSSL